MADEQTTYDSLFGQLASDLRVDGWQATQETPPGAYVHISRPEWGDDNMDGIHLEAYVLGGQLKSRHALVALHCEGGCPFQARFMGLVTERAAATIGSFPGGYKVLGPGGQTVCEVMVPFGATPGETVDRIVRELRTLQSLQPVIDEVIATCLAERTE